MKKANEHLATGDVAQCCEELFGCAKFVLRQYVARLGEIGEKPKIDPSDWTYAKYRQLCTTITCLEFDNNQKFDILLGWGGAEQ